MMNNVPKLRFGEFSGEWEEKKLIHTVDNNVKWSFTGGPFGSDLKSNDYTETGVRIIQLQNIGDGYFIDKYTIYTSQEKADKLLSCNIYPSEIIISKMGDPVARACKIPNSSNRYVMGSDGIRFIPNEVKYSKDFIFLSINHLNFRKKAIIKSTGSTRRRIGLTELKNITFFMPSKPEQQKIASFLTSIDTKIEQLTKKEELLKQYKKGVMQKIFSQEIRFRADDGSEFFEWEKKKLRDVAIKKSNKNKANSINRVFTNSAQYGIVDQRDFFDKDIANQNNLKGYYIVNKDDFIYNPRISNSAPVGPIKRNKLGQGVMSPLYTVLEFKQKYRDFYEFYFKTTLWHRYMYQIANFGARFDRMNITNSDFMKMPLPLPSLAEQTKIANFLSSIDDKIKQAQKHLNATKEFKKALLQQMFV